MSEDDPFKSALEAALAAKRPVITDEMRVAALRWLIVDAMGDPEARTRLVEVARLKHENADEVADEWIEANRESLRDIAASAKGPVPEVHPATSDDETPQPAQTQDWPPQTWRGPRDRERSVPPLTDEPSAEERAARGRARLEAEKYRSLRQAVYDTVDRSTAWLRRR
jgi:hypothetical protein